MNDLALHAGPVASLSGPIVDFCVNVIDDAGLAGIFVLMLAGSACIPVPSEAVMLFAGFTVSNGDNSLLGIIIAGFAGNMVGSWLAYAAGYYGRVDLLEKNRLIHLSPARLAWVDRFFAQHGDAAVALTRVMPVVRAFISLPAGVARMPFWRFSWLTALGSLPWVAGFAILGNAVGDNWDKWREHLQYADYVVLAAIVGLVVYLLIKRRRRGGRGEEEPEPAGAGGS
jgi:membrane protein DedA with SNARE-associated domain